MTDKYIEEDYNEKRKKDKDEFDKKDSDKSKAKLVSNILMNMWILFFILSNFFIFVISKESTKAFNSHFNKVFKSLVIKIFSKFKDQIPIDIKKTKILDKYEKYYAKTSKGVELYNEHLFFLIKLTLVICFIIVILILKYFIKKGYITINEAITLFVQNIIIFIFIGMVEMWFFTNVALKYSPVLASFMTKVIKSELETI